MTYFEGLVGVHKSFVPCYALACLEYMGRKVLFGIHPSLLCCHTSVCGGRFCSESTRLYSVAILQFVEEGFVRNPPIFTLLPYFSLWRKVLFGIHPSLLCCHTSVCGGRFCSESTRLYSVAILQFVEEGFVRNPPVFTLLPYFSLWRKVLFGIHPSLLCCHTSVCGGRFCSESTRLYSVAILQFVEEGFVRNPPVFNSVAILQFVEEGFVRNPPVFTLLPYFSLWTKHGGSIRALHGGALFVKFQSKEVCWAMCGQKASAAYRNQQQQLQSPFYLASR